MRRKAIPFYRTFKSGADHFYTSNFAEFQSAINSFGYKSEGIAGLIFPTNLQNTIPLYRVWNPGKTDHFYTTSLSERNNAIQSLGFRDEGIAGYVYKQPFCGSQPLFRLYSGSRTDHLYTMSLPEKDNMVQNGYTFEGIEGYLFFPPS